MNYLLHLLVYFDIFLIVALSLNLVVGYCGLLTMAHAGFYAIGAYAYALLSTVADWGFFPAAAAGMLVAGTASLLVSLPALRLRDDHFVLATLAVQALIFSALFNWSSPGRPIGSWANLTNGPFGISGIPRPRVAGWSPTQPETFAAFATAIAAAVGFALWRLQRSPWGRLLVAVRDDELAARGLGKNSRLLKVQAVAVASAIAALAGTLYASHVRYIDPSCASLNEGILMLSVVVVGGLGNFTGPLVGALVLVLMPEALRFLELPEANAANVRQLIYGMTLIALMHFRPNGIAGAYRVR